MNSVFSIDDLSDPFWQQYSITASSMDRSASERELAKFLEEVSAATQTPASLTTPSVGENGVVSSSQKLPRHPPDHVDLEEYHAFLKSKLDQACAAVAMSRTSTAKHEEITSMEEQSLVSKNFLLGSQAIGPSNAIPATQSVADGSSFGNSVAPTAQRKQDAQAQVRQTTSGSSRDDSDDDELEGDTGTNEHMDPADAKRARRMLSNRESARRSRRRKQAQLNELETQVGQLKDERSSLLSRFSGINQNCDEAAVDNRILKADIETLRAKVKMAEEQVKSVTGLNPMILARSNMQNMGVPFVGGQADPLVNIPVPVQPNSIYFHQPVLGPSPVASHLQGLNNFSNNTVTPPLSADLQMNRGTDHISGMASLQIPAGGKIADVPPVQYPHKPFDSTVLPNGTLRTHKSGHAKAVANDNKMK